LGGYLGAELGRRAAAGWEVAGIAGSAQLDVRAADGARDMAFFTDLVAAHHGRDPDALRGTVGGPGRPKRLALDCSRAQHVLRTRLRGVRQVLGP
jgi:hypothetical protein